MNAPGSGAGRPAGAVFISYSRRDYHFAESLSFALEKAGLPVWIDTRSLTPGADWADSIDHALDTTSCFVLVVSPDSMQSAHVRSEWRRALRQGKRVVVALFRRAAIPEDLRSCEVVDLRGRFGRGVSRLAATIAGAPGASEVLPDARLVYPPMVALVGTLLGLLWAAFVTLGVFLVGLSDLGGWGFVLVWVCLQVLMLYHVCIAFLRRRMAMSRLAACFGVFTFIFGYPILQRVAAGALPPLFPASVVQFSGAQWIVQWTLLAAALAGLALVCVVQPGDLVRWTPTGKAWSTYRRRLYQVYGETARHTFGCRRGAVRLPGDL